MHLGYTDHWKGYQAVLDTMTRLCPDLIAAVQGYILMLRMHFWRDGWHAT